jgi:hypothetical protein
MQSIVTLEVSRDSTQHPKKSEAGSFNVLDLAGDNAALHLSRNTRLPINHTASTRTTAHLMSWSHCAETAYQI